MIKQKVDITRTKTKHNRFLRNSVVNYLRYSTPSELKFDIIVPFITAIILTLLVSFIIPSPRDFVATIQDLNSIVITIIAILAGFNTASLAIIASANKFKITDDADVISVPQTKLNGFKKLKNLLVNNPSRSELETIVSCFSYAVISQLLILILSLIINVLLTSVLKIDILFPDWESKLKYFILIPFSLSWIFLILHAIFLSIRNIDMISHFIKYKP